MLFQVTDIAVKPSYQGRGLGKLIMGEIREFLHTVPDKAYVSLIADGKPLNCMHNMALNRSCHVLRECFCALNVRTCYLVEIALVLVKGFFVWKLTYAI